MVKYEKVELDRLLYAISDSTRRRILDELIRGELSLGELSVHFKMSLPGLLKHVRVLKEAELIGTKKEGRRLMCNIRPDNLMRVSTWLSKYQRFWEERLRELEEAIRTQRFK